MQISKSTWKTSERNRPRARELAQQLGLHPVAVEVLLQRGLTEVDDIQRFLYPDLTHLHDPFTMPGMRAAVERIRQAMEQGERILIYGDYDVDGLTATAILVRFMRDHGVCAWHYIPKRVEEGYGLNQEAIRELAESGVKLLITVDCGINSLDEVVLANELGVDVIITDHHTPDPSRRPPAVAVINPKLAVGQYPFCELAGVGVALKLVQALGGLSAVAAYLDLAALGTIADVVPLVGENRVIVKFGLAAMQETKVLGIAALLNEAKVAEGPIKAGQISFMLAPRLNAAGRLNQADRALDLLLTEDPAEASHLAALLSSYNAHRQEIEREIAEQADDMVQALPAEQRNFIVLAKEGWHQGIVGIVAARLAERYHRPVILLAINDGIAKGSGRSVLGYNLIEGLRRQEHLFIAYGGHQAAAGMTIAADNIPSLSVALNQHVAEEIKLGGLDRIVRLDAELDPSEVTLDLVRCLEDLGPYGPSHPEPIFCSHRWQMQSVRTVGKEGQHLKLQLLGGGMPWEAMAFRRGEELVALREQQWVDLSYTLQVNSWNGRESVVLHLKEWKPPTLNNEIAIFDARHVSDRSDYLQRLLQKDKVYLLLFWPAMAESSWPELWQLIGYTPSGYLSGPVILTRTMDGWGEVAAEQLEQGDLIWLDPPLGTRSLRALTQHVQARLYHLRIHLLYNGNDIDRAYKLLEMHGPSRLALAALYRGLRKNPNRLFWNWEDLAEIMRQSGYLALPDQIRLHLQVLDELALAECACAESGARLNWLPGQKKQDLSESKSFVAALAALSDFASARDWLRGPDAANILARQLSELVKVSQAVDLQT